MSTSSQEISESFLRGILNESDETLADLLLKPFDHFDEANCSLKTLEENGEHILEAADYGTGIHPLLILAATGKRETYNILKSHLEFSGAQSLSCGILYFLTPESDGFQGTESEATDLRNDSSSVYTFATDHTGNEKFYRNVKVNLEDIISFGQQLFLASYDYEDVTKTLRIENNCALFSFPRALFIERNKYKADAPKVGFDENSELFSDIKEDCAGREFSNFSSDPDLVTISIGLKSLID
jgi:hypothetical protein